jgi:hypothetical protein
VSESTKGYFHCGRCGRFFQAEIGVVAGWQCPHCGADPSLELEDRAESKLPASDSDVVRGMSAGVASTPAPPSGQTVQSGVHRRRRSAPVSRLVIFIAVWVFLLAGFAVFMKVVNDRREREEEERLRAYKKGRSVEEQGLQISERHRDRQFLKEAFPHCQTAFGQFLHASSPEARMQWVHESAELAGPMTRFYQSNLPYRPETAPKPDFIGVLETPGGLIIESIWDDEDGRRIEAHFRNDGGEWRLDWKGFVRFSETPWVMFVAGGGADVQEFRLLARERLAEERRLEPSISLVLHPPRFGVPEEPGPASREFEVPRLSEIGRKLEALFELKREGKAPFGARLPSQDPEEMIRVRLRVRRIDDETSRRKFEIEEVLAGHWMGIADPGIPETVEEAGDGEEAGSAE